MKKFILWTRQKMGPRTTIIASAVAITAVVGAAYVQAQGLTPTLKSYQQKLESLPDKGAAKGLSPAEQEKVEQQAVQLREKTADEAKTVAMGTGTTMTCLQDCSTRFDSCNKSATDWFQRYLCNIDATKCTIGCVAKY